MIYFEARDDGDKAREDEDLYAGVGQVPYNATQEHFPQLWCPSGNYSLNGQVGTAIFSSLLSCHEFRRTIHKGLLNIVPNIFYTDLTCVTPVCQDYKDGSLLSARRLFVPYLYKRMGQKLRTAWWLVAV